VHSETVQPTAEKVDISRIMIERIDGVPAKARVSSIDAANRVLDTWADRAPPTGTGVCEFEILFEDGLRYQGHYKLNKTQKRISLARYVRKQLAALAAGKAAAGKDFTALVKAFGSLAFRMPGADPAESARLALEHYNI
jgi:hypothetical protein